MRNSLSVVLCFILFPFAWTGGCLVMTQLSNKFVPFEKLLTKNALYQSSVGFVCGSGSCTMPWHNHQLSVLQCLLFFIISIQHRVQWGLDLGILEYEVDRIWIYFNRQHLVVMRNYYSNYILLYTENGKYALIWLNDCSNLTFCHFHKLFTPSNKICQLPLCILMTR